MTRHPALAFLVLSSIALVEPTCHGSSVAQQAAARPAPSRQAPAQQAPAQFEATIERGAVDRGANSQPGPPPGDPAPSEVVAEIKAGLAEALRRFERGDVEGVLASVSDRYRTGPLTKPVLRQQLLAMFATNDELSARVRIDDVRMIGDRAWIYSTGEVTGRMKLVGARLSLLAWDWAPEVAWREHGTWRLIGDQRS